ncbi:WD repeat-containing protein 88 [Meriones unguiculatus]|uniref:WD repeat-containing protein 88 n=1 Tax=Meriones unguiculatus TaxID=10047 RepID=UPI00293E4F1C|nr:WD repeat-containing protein 88 [Meriones unguiculatus]
MASPPDSRKALGVTSRGSAELRKGSGETRKLSAEMRKDSEEARRDLAQDGRKKSSLKRSPESKKGNVDEGRRATVRTRKASIDSELRTPIKGTVGMSSIFSSVRPNRLPWVTLLRAVNRFKISFPDIRRDQILAACDPLLIESEHPSHQRHSKTPAMQFWGDQQHLSKVPYKILAGHERIVSSCQFCMDDTRFVSGSYDCSVKLWDAAEGYVLSEFKPQPKAPVLECSTSADSRRLIASSYDKTVRAWDMETGQLLWKVRFDTFVVCCKFSPDGKYVLAALDVDCGFCLMDPVNISIVVQIKDHHKRSITACCFDPDSQKVASVSIDKSIKIWDITSQATLLTIPKAHKNAISDCCFTFSGHFLCTSSWDKNIKIWNVHTGEFRNRGACVTLMKGHQGCVSSCCISRDNSILISGGFDKTVAIWDVGDGYQKLALKGHDDWVTDVAISNNKKWILSASKDSNLRLWNIEEIDKIPLVNEKKKAKGVKVKQCKTCEQLYSTFEEEYSTKLSNRCVHCRRENRFLPGYRSSSSSSSQLSSSSSQGEYF